MSKLKVLDLFSGIGGFSLGLEATNGFETVAFCEIDKDCHKVLKKHWPTVPVFGDVNKLEYIKNYYDYQRREGINILGTSENLPGDFISTDIDVICGGFPCQDISVAGKQKGLIDEEGNRTRSGLWSEYKRLIGAIRPKYVIIENVRQLINNGLVTVLQDLNEIGYDAEWEIISARSIGAPHLRERVWIVAYPSRTALRNESGKLLDERGDSLGSREEGLLQEDWEAQNMEFRTSSVDPTNSNDFRFWPTFASEEEKLQWWTKTTSSIRDWWEVESSICRVDDGLPKELDRGRSKRIKQLGNAIVPQIATIIGSRILDLENSRK